MLSNWISITKSKQLEDSKPHTGDLSKVYPPCCKMHFWKLFISPKKESKEDGMVKIKLIEKYIILKNFDQVFLTLN